jgi:hypothetical protein
VTAKTIPRRMTAVELRRMEAWLRANPDKWAGWPTYMALDPGERAERLARLQHHGAPLPKDVYSGALIGDVNNSIATLRLEKRAKYVGMVNEAED